MATKYCAACPCVLYRLNYEPSTFTKFMEDLSTLVKSSRDLYDLAQTAEEKEITDIIRDEVEYFTKDSVAAILYWNGYFIDNHKHVPRNDTSTILRRGRDLSDLFSQDELDNLNLYQHEISSSIEDPGQYCEYMASAFKPTHNSNIIETSCSRSDVLRGRPRGQKKSIQRLSFDDNLRETPKQLVATSPAPSGSQSAPLYPISPVPVSPAPMPPTSTQAQAGPSTRRAAPQGGARKRVTKNFGSGMTPEKRAERKSMRRKTTFPPGTIYKVGIHHNVLREVNEVTDIHHDHRGITVTAIIVGGPRSPAKVEHFDIWKYKNGPQACKRWLRRKKEESKRSVEFRKAGTQAGEFYRAIDMVRLDET